MPAGQGLSSLIPKKNQEGAPAPASQPRPAAAEPRSYFTQNVRPNVMPERPPENHRPQPVMQHHSPIQAPKPQRSGEMVYQLETEKIVPNPYQPRSEFSDEGLRELAQSIREFGILQPLVVSKVTKETETGADVEYQLIAGERRLRAAKIAGLERVPAIVRNADGAGRKLEMALIENIQRQNLNPLEAAKAYSRLQDEFGLTQREIAARVGKSREAVANTIRLLNLAAEARQALAEGKINESQARTLLGFQNPEEQRQMLQHMLTGKITVRAARGEAERTKTQDPETGYWAKRFEEKLGSPVKVSKNGSRGKITVEFFSDDEWRALTDKLGGES